MSAPRRLVELLRDLNPQDAVQDPVQEFLARWLDWTAQGRTMPLPERWEVRVIALTRLGLTSDEIGEAIGVGMRQPGIVAGKRFAYTIGVGFSMASNHLGLSHAPIPSLTVEAVAAVLGPLEDP